MIKTYLKIALRNVLRQKILSLINIMGLSIGLVSFLGISLYVVDEFSYDRFQRNNDRIYRAIINTDFGGKISKWGSVPNKLAPTVAREIPDVEKVTRVFHHNFGDIGFVSTATDKFSETELYYADPEIFDVFTISLIKGTAEKALDRPGTIILSETSANRYFGDIDPIGKTLLVDNAKSYEVTGVYKDFPPNSFLKCQLLASFSSIGFGKEEKQSWGNASFPTYFLLTKGVAPETVTNKITDLLKRNIPEDDRWFTITLQPLLDIHLHSGDLTPDIDRGEYGDYGQIKILIALALIILLIAAVNYMNLTTAQAQRRNKEVGISKTLGATFAELNIKFYFEASIFILFSLLVSITVLYTFLPVLNSITGKSILNDFIFQGWFWVFVGGLWVLLTLISGFYPALYLSSFSPKTVLVNTSGSGGQASIRRVLVVVQFSISIILIISATMFYKQLNFMREKDLGYQPDQVIAVMVSAAKDYQQVARLKTAFESLAEVKQVAQSQSYPGVGTSGYTVSQIGGSDDGASILATRATHEILDVLGIKLLAGRTLPEYKDPQDTTVQVVINKSTADYLQLKPEDAIGKQVKIFYNQPTEVVGVVEDFHFASLHQQIGPYCFDNSKDNRYVYLLVKVQTRNLTTTVNKLKTTFEDIVPAAFEFTFLDEQMAQFIQADERLTDAVLLFAGLAIFIACLGLYALASFTAEQRIKEIGIRKVLGAPVTRLVAMLSWEFMSLVIIAIIIGLPAGYYLMDRWLEGFAYRTNPNVFIFIFAGMLALIIAWVTVSFKSFKAARKNPVDSLRI